MGHNSQTSPFLFPGSRKRTMVDETALDRLNRRITELEDSISQSATGMQSVSRTGISYTRVDPATADRLLRKLYRDRYRMINGGALSQSVIETSPAVPVGGDFDNPNFT